MINFRKLICIHIYELLVTGLAVIGARGQKQNEGQKEELVHSATSTKNSQRKRTARRGRRTGVIEGEGTSST